MENNQEVVQRKTRARNQQKKEVSDVKENLKGRDLLKNKLLNVFKLVEAPENKIVLENGASYTKVSTRRYELRKEFGLNVRIITILKEHDGNSCLFEAQISFYDEERQVWEVVANGHALELRNSTEQNRLNYLENCETSAIGRALDNLGINGGDLPSDSELAKQLNLANQKNKIKEVKSSKEKTKTLVSVEDIENINKIIKENKITELQIFKNYGISKIEELPKESYEEILKILSEDVPL